MIVLVINSGSSSVKYQLFDMEKEEVLAKGIAERIKLQGSFLKHKRRKSGQWEEFKIVKPFPSHREALKEILNILTDPEKGVIKSLDEISAVGHRVVHGAERFVNPILIDDEVKKTIRDCFELAPLHNPPNLLGIEACMELLPGKPNVAVFDTAFHQTIPEHAYLYAVPYEWYEKYRVRRYGFHGISHEYVSKRVAELVGRPYESLRIIVAHLGNGASITAVKNGKSIDTSMGFTPLEGLVMGTRSGDIDPAIIPYMMKKLNKTADEIVDILNKKSGLLGLSGISNDMRDIEIEAWKKGNKRADLSLRIYAYRVKKYIGAYAAALGGLDVLAFTAGVGERGREMREMICEGLEFLGIKIDRKRNMEAFAEEMRISADDSKVEVWVVPTNEELLIARATRETVEKEGLLK